MKEKLKRSSFMRNFLVLFSASFIAQVITLISSPVLTRLYGPDDFGVFSFYLAIVSIVIVFVTGSYEYSINTIRSDEDSYLMLKLIAIYTIILVVIYITISEIIIRFFINENSIFDSKLSLLTALSLLITGWGTGLRYHLNRRKKISVISKSKIYNSITNNTASIILGMFGFNFFGLVLSHILANLLMLFNNYRNTFLEKSFFIKKIEIKKILELGKVYKEYPLFNSFSLFFNAISLQAPVLIFIKFFSEATVGFYSLTIRAIGMPLSLMSATLSQVFLSEISELERESKPFIRILIKALMGMSLIGILPLLIIVFFGQEIFVLVFGEDWREAGSISQVIIFAYYFKFIISPLSVVFYVKKKVKFLLNVQSFRSITTFLVLILGSMSYDFSTVILLYTLHECTFYIIFLICILKISR